MLATRRGSAHYPSMLEDVEARRPTEIELITGSLVREAERLGVPVPLHTALYRLIKAKEASWDRSNRTIREETGMRRRRWARSALLLRARRAGGGAVGDGARRLGDATRRRGADRDRLGLRQRAADGAVRRPGARRGADPRRGDQREGRRRRPRARRSRPATRRTTTRRRRSRAPRPARRRRGHHVRDLRRRLRDAGRAGGDQPGHARGRAVHRHRPDGPEALRRGKGRLAFSFGNVAQDEGSAMAEYAWSQGWQTAALATNTLLVYFKNVVEAFEKRFTQLGGRSSRARATRPGRTTSTRRSAG